MTLSELRQLLISYGHLSGDTPIVLQTDAEGDGFLPMAGGGERRYVSGSYSRYGDVYPTPEQIAARSYLGEEDSAPDNAVPCIVLWPVN
jgi:hypothetical protein